MLVVQRANVFRLSFVKARVLRDANAGSGPHGGAVKILLSVMVKIAPASAHASANVFDAGFRGDTGKSSVALVAIKIVAAEVVGNVEVRVTVGIVVAPGASKTEAVIVDVHAGCRGSVHEGSVAFVVKEEIGRAVARVEIRSGIVILVETHVIRVEAKINVEAAVAVIVGNRGMGERSLRRLSELKGVALS